MRPSERDQEESSSPLASPDSSLPGPQPSLFSSKTSPTGHSSSNSAPEFFKSPSGPSPRQESSYPLPSESSVFSSSESSVFSQDSSPPSAAPTTQPPDNVHDDKPPLSQPIAPLTIRIGNATCSLRLIGSSKKLFYDHHPSYSFASDDACDRRNREMDASLLASEREARRSREYATMRNQTLRLDGVFPEDHVSPYFTIVRFNEIHSRERRVVSLLTSRMHRDSCFAPVVAKYKAVATLLSFNEVEWVQAMRARIKNRTASTSEVERFKSMQNELALRRARFHSDFHNVKHYSDRSMYCDGCMLPPNRKEFGKKTGFANGLLIRKFVGDKEVPYVDEGFPVSTD